jgi:hypothetical protein
MKLKLLSPKGDAFEEIEDAFSGIELPPEEKLKYDADFQKMVAGMVADQLKAAIAALPKPEAPKQIVKEVRVEVPKKDTRELVEKKSLDEALKKIEDLEKKLEETDRVARVPMVIPSHGGPGVIGIPPPEAASVNQVLTVNADRKAQWKDSTGGGAGLTGMSSSNHVELLTFDETDTSIDELAKVVGTIIDQLS